jgi:hypothetical protein
MDEILKVSAQESAPADSRKWISRIVIAVIIGEAIWGFLVSVTNNLALPAMARVMGGDAQSPLYLGKGDFNVPALFASILELCFAGIVALVLHSWSGRAVRVRAKPAPRAALLAPTPVAAPPADSPPIPAANTAVQAKPPVATGQSAPQPARPSTQPAKPIKPKQPKEVYYNIVGEPVDPEDE